MTLVRRATACTGDRLVRSSVGRVSACAPPSSLGGAPRPGGCPGLTVHAGARRGIGFRRHADGRALSPLEIGLQAIQPWPYRAGLAARRPERLQTTTASLACSCPLALSRPGRPGDPGTRSSKFLLTASGMQRSASRRTPCVRFSRTRLSEIVHRAAVGVADAQATVPLRVYTPRPRHSACVGMMRRVPRRPAFLFRNSPSRLRT